MPYYYNVFYLVFYFNKGNKKKVAISDYLNKATKVTTAQRILYNILASKQVPEQ